jgi:membrane-associated phospholipid phosphatase
MKVKSEKKVAPKSPSAARKANESDNAINSQSRRTFLGIVTTATVAVSVIGVPSLGILEEATAQTTTSCTPGCEKGPLTGVARADTARQRRISAADYERNMPIPTHPCNDDEVRYASANYVGSYTKGLPHEPAFGEVDSSAYCIYLHALETGNPADFEAIPLGCNPCSGSGSITFGPGGVTSDAESRLAPTAAAAGQQRRLTSPQAGYNFDLEGKDYHQLTNRPASSPTLAFPPAYTLRSNEEAVEIIENYWQAITRDVPFINYASDADVAAAAADLNVYGLLYKGPRDGSQVTPRVYSRGILPGDTTGPFLSQFLLRPIPYGAQLIDPRILSPVPGTVNDFMTTFSEWLTIQNGCTPSRTTTYFSARRFIRNGRDLAEYVRNDAIYQAYLNAALIMMTPASMGGLGIPLDPNNPYRNYCRQDNFVEFGPSQLLALLGEVSVRAHKAVWYQKWQVHRRLRPEEYGARAHFKLTNQRNYEISDGFLSFSPALSRVNSTYGSYFLPQAFPEGSPVHPSYGAGHATLAGACVTILKAWFDESLTYSNFATPVEPAANGLSVTNYTGTDAAAMTIGGELNKLASNIAIARNIAGVHWRSDYTESVYLGEQVAIQLLEDYGFTYNENFVGFGLRNFNGSQQTVGPKRTS